MSRIVSLPRLAFLVLLLPVLLGIWGCGDKKKDYAALINDTPITKAELKAELDRIKQRFYNAAPTNDQQTSQLEKEILDIMIGGELLYQASQKDGIKVGDQEVKEELAKNKQAFPDTDKFKNTFTERDIRKKIAIDRFIAKAFAEPTTITDEQCQKYYDDNKADFTRPEEVLVSQVLLKVKEDAPKAEKDKVLAKMKAIQKELAKDGDFAALAKKYSEDSSASVGGVMGVLLHGQAEKAIDEAAFSLDPDKTTIVETKAGYHLIKATNKKAAELIPYSQVVEKLRNFLKQQEVQKKIDTFIKEARQKAKIEILLTT